MADYSALGTDESPDAQGVVDDAPDDKKKDSDSEILKASRAGLKICIDDEQEERQKMMDDLKFATLDQWPEDIRRQREGDLLNGPRPCLTVDQINQYTTQVSNDMASNRPAIKVRPVDDTADPDTANIYQGLIRHIEDQSSAYIAYQTAGDSAVTIGLGFFRVVADYASPDSFNQELLIKRIPDTFSVYLSAHVMPDGSDADAGWILDKMPIAEFKRQYPKARAGDDDFAGLGITPTWKTADTIMVCEYYYKSYTQETLLYLADGNSVWESEYGKQPEPRQPVTGKRTSTRVTIKWCKHTGCEVLDKRSLPGRYIPIVEEIGKEKIVDGKRILWGLVRPAKDSLRAFNYWISAMTEKMALAPKAPWIGAVGQFATQGDKWDKANVNNYSRLEYDPIDVNGNALPAPRRTEPIQMEPAMAQMLQIMQNNVKSSLGMYKASVGDTDSQQSGRAILALKKESDTGTSHFGANQAISVTHCGRILLDLIPHYYDTKQIIRILGEDGKPQAAAIDPELKNEQGMPIPKREIVDQSGKIRRIYNLGVGKYDVTATVGPGYTTSRQEAATVMMDLANSAKDPISAAIMRYGAVKNSDFSGSEEITKMLKVMLPPQIQQEEGQPEVPPQAMQKIAQLTQGVQMAGQQIQELTQENQQLKAGAQADMMKTQAQHQEKMKQLELDGIFEAEKLRQEEERARRELILKEWVAKEELRIKEEAALHEKILQEKDQTFQHMLDRIESIHSRLMDFEVASAKQSQES